MEIKWGRSRWPAGETQLGSAAAVGVTWKRTREELCGFPLLIKWNWEIPFGQTADATRLHETELLGNFWCVNGQAACVCVRSGRCFHAGLPLNSCTSAYMCDFQRINERVCETEADGGLSSERKRLPLWTQWSRAAQQLQPVHYPDNEEGISLKMWHS